MRRFLILVVVTVILGGLVLRWMGAGGPSYDLDKPIDLSPPEETPDAHATPSVGTALGDPKVPRELREGALPAMSERQALDDSEPLEITVEVNATMPVLGAKQTGPRGFLFSDPETTTARFPYSIWLASSTYPHIRLYEGVTGEDGKDLVKISLPPELHATDLLQLNLLGRIGLGFRDNDTALDLPEGKRGHYRLNISVRTGGTLRGRVEDEAGEPVRAKLVFWDEESVAEGKPAPLLRYEYSQNGRFKIGYDKNMRGSLFASAWALGNAALSNLVLDVDHPLPEQLLVIRGAGELKGVVLDARGEPVPDLPLLVQLDSIDSGGTECESLEPIATTLLQEGLGRIAVELTTDPQGRFRGAGLRLGRYVVRTRGKGTDGGYPMVLSASPVEANGAPVELRFSPARLVVRLFDELGTPWEGPVHHAGSDGLPRPLSVPRIIVVPSAKVGGTQHAEGQFLGGRKSGPGVFEYDLYPRRDHLVGILGEGFPEGFRVLEAPGGESRAEFSFEQMRANALGTLELRVDLERSGGFVSLGLPPGALLITVIHVATGIPVWDEEFGLVNQTLSTELPPGEYRVLVEQGGGAAWGPTESMSAVLDREAVTLGAGVTEIISVRFRD